MTDREKLRAPLSKDDYPRLINYLTSVCGFTLDEIELDENDRMSPPVLKAAKEWKLKYWSNPSV